MMDEARILNVLVKNSSLALLLQMKRMVGGFLEGVGGRREGDIKECKLFNKTSVIGE